MDAPAKPKELHRWPEVGKVNHLEAFVGNRGMGKTTYAEYRALYLTRSLGGGYMLGHSLGARLTRRLPPELGGLEVPLAYHPTLAKLERGVRRHPDKWHILAPSIDRVDRNRDTADDLLKYAVSLSRAVRRDAWRRAHPFRVWHDNVDMSGVHCPPILVFIDEGIAIRSATTNRKDDNDWFLEFIYSLRHFHIIMLYNIQDTTSRSWRIIEQCNEMYIFHMRHQWALEAIRAAGATKAQLEQIPYLPPYHYVHLDLHGVPPTERAAKMPAPTNELIDPPKEKP